MSLRQSTSNEAIISATTSSATISSNLSKESNDTEFSENGYFCQGSGHYESLASQMYDYYKQNKLCDVTLISGLDGRRFSVHRLVLSSTSPYFAAMFCGNLREATEQEITLQEMDGDSLFQLIQYCYTGTIDLREETVEKLLANACLLQLTTVSQACCNFLARQLHPSNCLGFALFAEQQGCKSLLDLAHAYTCQKFMQVCKNQEFYDLNKDQLAALLKSDDLNVPSEKEVFFALTEWIQHDTPNRKKYLAELLALIKLPLLEPSFIVDHIEKLSDVNECQKLLMEAMKWHLLPERRAELVSQRTKPRKSTIGRLLVIGGMDSNKGPLTIESYCPRNDEWKLLKNLPARRLQFGVIQIDNKIAIVGGRDGLKTLNTVESFDLASMVWQPLVPMNTHRHGLCVTLLGGALYAIGGHDGWSYLNTCERYDFQAKSWSFVAPMQCLRSTAGIAVLGGKIYVVGGRDGTICHRSVECYDPHTNRWSNKAPMNKRRGGVGVGVCNGHLYALGGHDTPASNPAVSRTETVERYDVATDTWTMIASLSTGRDAIGVGILGGSLIAVGGYDGNYLRTVEKYDEETNEWTSLAPINYSRAGACVVAIPNVYSSTASIVCTNTANNNNNNATSPTTTKND
ncbi:kelch-like protein 5 [Culicoides brevitarsis]|uniref:kelch-like protein 5 n=1 Tax=Culicoides brevitarsis TaxID=469753 RepID=UPI00307C6382